MPTLPPALRPPLTLIALLLLLPVPAGALELREVVVQGLADEEMRDNVQDALSLQRLNPNRRKAISESRLSYLLRKAPGEARGALEPFGYYEPVVETQVQRTGEAVTVLVTVTPGEPVRVRRHDVVLTGPAEADTPLMRRIERFRPRVDQPFHHGIYEDSKAAMDRALAERGYFDAELVTHRVTVTRAERSADIDLAWTSGERYRLGVARFEGHQFNDGLLEKLQPWTPGDLYSQTELLDLQKSLSELDYFSAIDITAEPDKAVDGRVPVKVALVPGKRSVYNAGVRYGTDTGVGVTGGVERRWVNRRGHKLRAQAGLAQRKNDVTVQYKIPAFAWLDGWYTFGASVREEEIDLINSQLVEVVGSRSGKLGRWNLIAALNFRRERYDDAQAPDSFNYSTLVFPSLWAQWTETDDVLYPRRARGLTMELRGGSTGLGSDIDFVQVRAEGRFIHGFGRRDRLLLRAELGTTISDQFELLPPSMRFYAGGDNSVRGYGYQEIGESLTDYRSRRYVYGGKHLVTGSVEYEHMFTRTWGGAAFVDAGDAFDERDDLDWQVGIGAGLRWRSPVGPVRVDVAHGLGDQAQNSVRLHLTIGPDL
ncbi:autotransporter assembly complex protein TamA [Arenimonas sp. MALMAid1274]|uniref:autotransporter assembly complex protein TamA n=1 Tax=Arenimonas sp. MALMAid1274 TaxID=3411630 RepID=UPI003B9E46DA